MNESLEDELRSFPSPFLPFPSLHCHPEISERVKGQRDERKSILSDSNHLFMESLIDTFEFSSEISFFQIQHCRIEIENFLKQNTMGEEEDRETEREEKRRNLSSKFDGVERNYGNASSFSSPSSLSHSLSLFASFLSSWSCFEGEREQPQNGFRLCI